MAKTFNVALIKNIEKNGAWLSIVTIKNNLDTEFQIMNTWLNQDSAKKWINDQLNALTGYKEIELTPDEEQDQDNNYISFTGVLTI
jgi:hypothetical protein